MRQRINVIASHLSTVQTNSATLGRMLIGHRGCKTCVAVKPPNRTRRSTTEGKHHEDTTTTTLASLGEWAKAAATLDTGNKGGRERKQGNKRHMAKQNWLTEKSTSVARQIIFLHGDVIHRIIHCVLQRFFRCPSLRHCCETAIWRFSEGQTVASRNAPSVALQNLSRTSTSTST